MRIDRLRHLREERGWSQRELARRCGFVDGQIRKYEVGQSDPTSTSLKLMAEQLEVSTDYLLGISDDPRRMIAYYDLSADESALLERYRLEGWPGVIHLIAERYPK